MITSSSWEEQKTLYLWSYQIGEWRDRLTPLSEAKILRWPFHLISLKICLRLMMNWKVRMRRMRPTFMMAAARRRTNFPQKLAKVIFRLTYVQIEKLSSPNHSVEVHRPGAGQIMEVWTPQDQTEQQKAAAEVYSLITRGSGMKGCNSFVCQLHAIFQGYLTIVPSVTNSIGHYWECCWHPPEACNATHIIVKELLREHDDL